jgi:ribonuclease HII
MTIGIDEVGRGAYAGPLVVGAVALPKGSRPYLDSKQLSPLARQKFAKQIWDEAEYCQLGWVWPDEIDRLGLTSATRLAIERSLKNAPTDVDIIIDGSVNFLRSTKWKARCEPKADARYSHVAAASIVAKVARDAYMHKLAIEFPDYGFERHVGYGVPEHESALQIHGVTKHHRKRYKSIRKIVLDK